MKTFIESNFDRPNCLILDFMFGVDFILAGNLLNWVKKNIASFLTSIASCIKETYVARTWINSQSYQMSLKCNSDWDYFHILYWISPKVTEYLNVSQPGKVQKFLSSVPLPIGQSAATLHELDQWELRKRSGSPTEAGLRLLSFSTLRRSQPACLSYFYPQDVKYNGSEAHINNAKHPRVYSICWTGLPAWHLSLYSAVLYFLNFSWCCGATTDSASKMAVTVTELGEVSNDNYAENYNNEITANYNNNISPHTLTLQQTSQWD